MGQLGNNNRRSMQPLKKQTEKKEKSTQIPLVMTHNQTLPNFRKIVRDKCSLLKTNNKLKNVMKEQPIIAYR